MRATSGSRVRDQARFWGLLALGLAAAGTGLAGDLDRVGFGGVDIGYGDPIRVALFGGAYIAGAAALLFGSRTLAHVRHGAVGYALLLVYVLSSSLWSRVPWKVGVNWVHLVGITLVAIASLNVGAREPVRVIRVLAASLSLSAALSIGVVWLMPSVGIDMEFSRWRGLAGHPNTLGVLCAVGVWAAMAGLVLERSWGIRTLYVGGGAACVVALLGSRSATSIVVAWWFVLGVLIVKFVAVTTTGGRVGRWGVVLLVGLASVMAVGLVRPEAVSVEGVLHALGREHTLTGRLELWHEGWRVAKEQLWFGWGFDSLASLPSRTRMMYGQFHNGYLDLLVRGGVVGVVLVVMLLAIAFARLVGLLAGGNEIGGLLLVLLAGGLLHNVTEASLVHAPNLLWLLLTLVLFWSAVLTAGGKEAVASVR